MGNLWDKIVAAVIIFVSMAWMISTFTGKKPSEMAEQVARERRKINSRLNSENLDPKQYPEDRDFQYKKFSKHMVKLVRRKVDVSSKKLLTDQPTYTYFYRQPVLPLIVKKGVIVSPVIAGNNEPSQTEELAVLNAPLSATFVPGNAGNLIKVQLDSIDHDRHMIRLAAEIQRASREPAKKGEKSGEWSEWKTIKVELLDPNDPVAKAFADTKLTRKEPAEGDSVTVAARAGTGVSDLAAGPETGQDISAGPGGGFVPPTNSTRKIVRRSTSSAGGGIMAGPGGMQPAVPDDKGSTDLVDAKLYDVVYLDSDIEEKTEYKYRVRMAGKKTTAESRYDPATKTQTEVLFTADMDARKEKISNGTVYLTQWLDTKPAVTPKNMEILYTSSAEIDGVRTAFFKIRYWVKDLRDWEVVSTKQVTPGDEVTAKASGKNKSLRDIATGLRFKRIVKEKGGMEEYDSTVYEIGPDGRVISRKVTKTKQVQPREVAILEDIETGNEVRIPKTKKFQSSLTDYAEIRALIKKKREALINKRKKRLSENQQKIEQDRQNIMNNVMPGMGQPNYDGPMPDGGWGPTGPGGGQGYQGPVYDGPGGGR